MLKFTPYIMKTLWRHRTRSLLTVSGSAVALFVFCFVGSIQEGLRDLLSQQEAQQSLIVFQVNKFCPATSHLPQDYDRKIAALPGVTAVVPVQVFTNNCRASLDVVVFYGVPPKKLKQVRDFNLIDGDWQQFYRHQDAAIVGQSVAQRRGVNVGEKFSVGDHTVTVAGIYASRNAAEENYIYTHLDFLQRRRGHNLVGTVTQFEVLLENDGIADATCSAIDDTFRGGPVQTDTRPKGVFQAKSLGDLAELIALAHYLGLTCVGLAIMLVATTTFMAVHDRVNEHAILQTVGFAGRRIFGLVLSESVILSAIGGIVGVGAAMLMLSWSGLAVGAEAVTVAFTPSLRLALIGCSVALITGLFAGVVPAWQAARAEIVPSLRQA